MLMSKAAKRCENTGVRKAFGERLLGRTNVDRFAQVKIYTAWPSAIAEGDMYGGGAWQHE
jgi:hypothetical protein